MGKSNNRILITNNLVSLKKSLASFGGCGRFVILFDNKESLMIREYLEANGKYEEIDRRLFNLKWSEDFRCKYINLIASLNIQNHSFYWWALNMPTKCPVASKLPEQIFNFSLIVDSFKNVEQENLIIVSNDYILNGQIAVWAKGENIHLEVKHKYLFPLRKIAILVFSFLRILRRLVGTLFWNGYLKLNYRVHYKKDIDYVTLATLLSRRTFRTDGEYRDSFFGILPEYFSKKELSVLVFAYLYDDIYGTLLKMKQMSNESGVTITPLQANLSFFDIINCFLVSIYYYFFFPEIKGDFVIDGLNVESLIKNTVRAEMKSGSFFESLEFYLATKTLLNKARIKSFFYPFENRPIEKMMLLALRKYAPKTEVVGFQHANITLKHLAYYFTESEIEITPLPDVIVTMGKTTKDILVNICNVPENIIKVGCGLRQNSKKIDLNLEYNLKKISSVLVVLSTNIEEYVRSLLFLNDVELTDFNVQIRPHPAIPFQNCLKIMPPLKFKYYYDPKISLEEAFKWADLIVYTSSTIAIEALLYGKPVVFLSSENFLNPDPLFELTDFKWIAESPQKLTKIIQEIQRLNHNDYLSFKSNAYNYAKNYILPVDEENLRIFYKLAASEKIKNGNNGNKGISIK
jgi:hypothetical protein